jgi:hypothetical protein
LGFFGLGHSASISTQGKQSFTLAKFVFGVDLTELDEIPRNLDDCFSELCDDLLA